VEHLSDEDTVGEERGQEVQPASRQSIMPSRVAKECHNSSTPRCLAASFKYFPTFQPDLTMLNTQREPVWKNMSKEDKLLLNEERTKVNCQQWASQMNMLALTATQSPARACLGVRACLLQENLLAG